LAGESKEFTNPVSCVMLPGAFAPNIDSKVCCVLMQQYAGVLLATNPILFEFTILE
jgi:hypothetical protein